MKNNNNYVAPQQLQAISNSCGTAINQTANRLLAQLASGAVMSWHSGSANSRTHVELREAKTLLKQLRYPDASMQVRVDEMAWALQTVKEACRTHGVAVPVEAFDKAAKTLNVDLNTHAIPLDMQKKINNEMRMFEENAAVPELAQAV